MDPTLNTKLQTVLNQFTKIESPAQLNFATTFESKNPYRNADTFVNDMKMLGIDLGLPGIQLHGLESDAYVYNSEDQYLDTNICFQTTDNNASKNQTYQSKGKGEKTNTYILCGICDPFEAYKTGKTGTKNCTMDGVTHQIDIRSPIHNFHNTLGSAYVNHMADHHGIRRGGVQAKKPLLGFTDYRKDDFALCVICPYTHSDNKPCLSSFKYNYNGEHGYKGYFRHVKACHWAELKKGARETCNGMPKDVKYIPQTPILPYNALEFEQVTGEADLYHVFHIIQDDLATVQIQKAAFGGSKTARSTARKAAIPKVTARVIPNITSNVTTNVAREPARKKMNRSRTSFFMSMDVGVAPAECFEVPEFTCVEPQIAQGYTSLDNQADYVNIDDISNYLNPTFGTFVQLPVEQPVYIPPTVTATDPATILDQLYPATKPDEQPQCDSNFEGFGVLDQYVRGELGGMGDFYFGASSDPFEEMIEEHEYVKKMNARKD